MKWLVFFLAIVALLGVGKAVEWGFGKSPVQTWTVGPFTVEALERRISSGRFPNISGNPFERVSVTEFRVLYQGRPVVPPGVEADRTPQWSDVRQISGAPQPALLLLDIGAVLLTEKNGQPHLQELAPREASQSEWLWLDGHNGQPTAPQVSGLGHRPGHVLELSGGRWLSIYDKSFLDTQTLTVYRRDFTRTEIQEQFQEFYAVNSPTLAFSPGSAHVVVLGSRKRQVPTKTGKDSEYALIAFDFVRERSTVMPIDLQRWRLYSFEDIDSAFAQRVVGWRRGPDGYEQAFLRSDLPIAPWQGTLKGQIEKSLSYQLGPVHPSMRAAMVGFLEKEFNATVTPNGGTDTQYFNIQIDGMLLGMADETPKEFSLVVYNKSEELQREAQANTLIQRIAERFNARLAAGEFQAHFVAD